MALRIRRLKERAAASNLIHIGTSATMVSNRDATPLERRTAVGARDSTKPRAGGAATRHEAMSCWRAFRILGARGNKPTKAEGVPDVHNVADHGRVNT